MSHDTRTNSETSDSITVKPRLAVGHGSNKRLLIKKKKLVAIRTLKRRQRRWRSYTTALSVPASVAVSVGNLKSRREILVQPSGTLRGPAHDSAYLRQSSVGRLRVLLNYLLLPQLAVVIGPNHLLAPAVRRGGSPCSFGFHM